MDISPEKLELLIVEIVETAKQACRYMGKHNESNQNGEYKKGFQTACHILGTMPTIAEHVERHKDRILAMLEE